VSESICESYRAIEHLIRKHAPRLMREGGGGTAGEHDDLPSRERKTPLNVKKPIEVTPQMEAAWVKMYLKQTPITEIAREYKCASSTVMLRLKKAGVWKRRLTYVGFKD
jgi:hypothetical protein